MISAHDWRVAQQGHQPDDKSRRTGPPGDIRPTLRPRHGQPPNALSIFYVFGSNTTAIGGQVKLYV